MLLSNHNLFYFKDQKFSENDIKTLLLQRDMLMNKLDEFELANKKLRELLRDTQQKQVRRHGFFLKPANQLHYVIVKTVTVHTIPWYLLLLF